MVRKTKHYLKRHDLVELYDDFIAGRTTKALAKKFRVSYTTAMNAIKDLQRYLTGDKIERIKSKTEYEMAVELIKAKNESGGNGYHKPEIVHIEEHTTVFVGDAEANLTKAWDGLQEAIAGYVEEKVAKNTAAIQEEYQALKQVASKSNIVGFLNARLKQ